MQVAEQACHAPIGTHLTLASACRSQAWAWWLLPVVGKREYAVDAGPQHHVASSSSPGHLMALFSSARQQVWHEGPVPQLWLGRRTRRSSHQGSSALPGFGRENTWRVSQPMTASTGLHRRLILPYLTCRQEHSQAAAGSESDPPLPRQQRFHHAHPVFYLQEWARGHSPRTRNGSWPQPGAPQSSSAGKLLTAAPPCCLPRPTSSLERQSQRCIMMQSCPFWCMRSCVSIGSCGVSHSFSAAMLQRFPTVLQCCESISLSMYTPVSMHEWSGMTKAESCCKCVLP